MTPSMQSLLVALLFASQSLAAPHVKKDYVPDFPGQSPATNTTTSKVKRSTLPTFPGYEYISCYTDSQTHRTLQGKTTSDPSMTIEMCASFCTGGEGERAVLSSLLTKM